MLRYGSHGREIQEQILAGAAETELAVINAALVRLCLQSSAASNLPQTRCSPTAQPQVPDLVILRSAAHKAATAAQRNRLRTRSLHSECIVNISGSKHVRNFMHLVFKLLAICIKLWLPAALLCSGCP